MSNTSSSLEASNPALSVKPDQNILTAAKGGGIVFAGNLFQYGGRFLIGLLVARLLGAEQFGLTSLALSAVYIVSSLASLGLAAAMTRYVAIFASRRDSAGLWGTLQIGAGLTASSGLLTAACLYLLADLIAERVFHAPRLSPQLRIVSLVVPFLAVGDILAGALRGFKRMDYAVVGNNVSQTVVRLVLTLVIALAMGLSAKKALAAFNISAALSFFVMVYFLHRLFPLKRSLQAARRDLKEVLTFSLPIYLSTLIRTFGGNIQIILLGALSSVTNVGIFTVAAQVNLVGHMFHGAIDTASGPIVCELHDRGEREQMRRFYQTATKWTFTLNLPLFLIVLLFPGPILSIFGASYAGGVTALTILAWTNLVNTGTGICEVLVSMTGNTHLRLLNSIVAFALTLGLNALLVPRWALMGAAAAALASATVLNLLRLLEVFWLFRLHPYNMSFLKPVAAGLLSVAIAGGVRVLSPPSASLIYIIINVAVILAVYAGAILVLGLSQEDRMVLNRISRRVSAVWPR